MERSKKNIHELRLKAKHLKCCLSKLSLLEAELASVHRNIEKAEMHYNKAILFSRENDGVNMEAMVCERAGLFFLEANSMEKTTSFLLQSYTCYKKWGAKAKMAQLIKEYPFLREEINKPVSDVVSIMKDAKLEAKMDRSVRSLVSRDKKKRIRPVLDL